MLGKLLGKDGLILLTLFLLFFVDQKLIQALLQFVEFSLFPFHLMIILAGPACNYVLKFLHLQGEVKQVLTVGYIVVPVTGTKQPIMDSLNTVRGSIQKYLFLFIFQTVLQTLHF